MMRTKKILACLAVFLGLGFCCSGLQAGEGCYVGVGAGVNVVDDQLPGVDFAFDIGPAASVIAGYGWCGGLRTEVEASYRYNSMGEVKIDGLPTQISGHLDAFSVMGNAVCDFAPVCGWQLFIGVGGGWVYERIDFSGANLSRVESVDSRFAYQALAGFSRPLTSCIELGIEYRFFVFDPDARSHSLGIALRRYF